MKAQARLTGFKSGHVPEQFVTPDVKGREDVIGERGWLGSGRREVGFFVAVVIFNAMLAHGLAPTRHCLEQH